MYKSDALWRFKRLCPPPPDKSSGTVVYLNGKDKGKVEKFEVGYQRFKGPFCLRPQGEAGGSMDL